MSITYKGYTINSAPYSAQGGGFTVNGRIIDPTFVEFINPFDEELYKKIYPTKEEADQAFIDYAIVYIDKI